MDRIVEDYDSKFRFVLLAAQRAEQLIQGAQPRIEVRSPKIATTAMHELIEQRIEWGYGPAPEGFDDTDGEADATETVEEES